MSPAAAWARTLLLFGAALLCTAALFALTLWLKARYGGEATVVMDRVGPVLALLPLAAVPVLWWYRRRFEP